MSIKLKNILSNQAIKYPSTSFTLIEMMVSIGIITIVIVTATGIYLFSIGPQQKTTATANLQQDGQLILNMIAKDIRQNKIDYSDYPCGISCSCTTNDWLTLTDETNRIKYLRCEVGSNTLCDSGPNCALKKCRGTGCGSQEACNSNFKEVTMKDVSVWNFQVTICPGCNPFSGSCSCESPCYQNPQVTVVLELKSYKERIGERRIKLQQTIPQRYQEKSYY